MELTRAPLDRVKTVLAVGNYEIKTSNDKRTKYHERHCATSKLHAPTKEIFKNEMPPQTHPPPPKPPPSPCADRGPAHPAMVCSP